jgi:hypothetical protein
MGGRYRVPNGESCGAVCYLTPSFALAVEVVSSQSDAQTSDIAPEDLLYSLCHPDVGDCFLFHPAAFFKNLI